MNAEAYFAWILIILTALIFIALVLGFLYMVYGKEEEKEED
jgi:succinate dehydrogenase hydrophobic anchor subunit